MRRLGGGVTLATMVACGYPRPTLTNDQPCTDAQMICIGNQLETCVDGAFVDTELCSSICDDHLGCVACKPGTGTCNGNVAHTCDETGMTFEDIPCDPVQGMTCDTTVGACAGACSPAALGKSNVGCEFYPVVTGTLVDSIFDFAIVIANQGTVAANVTIEGGVLTAPTTLVVPPAGTVVKNLPWQYDLKLCPMGNPSNGACPAQRNAVLAPNGAYHLRSDAPLAVWQFDPVETTIGAASAYTNDASLLLPVTAWGTEYYIASFAPTPASGNIPPMVGELAVVARGTTSVTITTTAATVADGGVPAFAPTVAQAIALKAGDALELTSSMGDLTGTHVVADHPVQVIGGHSCATVPAGIAACDHLEESMLPVRALGTDYVVVAAQNASSPNGNAEVVRILATAANTHLTYDPVQLGAPTTLAHAGDFIEITNAATFEVRADRPVMIAQYMEGGQSNSGNKGDPALSIAVPVAQYRTAYTFAVPPSFTAKYVDIVAPLDTHLQVDGATKTVIAATTSFGLLRLAIPATTDGRHVITGDHPFGLQIYGDDTYTAFWSPGGLDAKTQP